MTAIGGGRISDQANHSSIVGGGRHNVAVTPARALRQRIRRAWAAARHSWRYGY